MKHLAKFAHYQEELEQFRKGEPVRLRRIQMDPVSYCNHDCPFCIYRYNRDEDMNALFNLKDMLSLEKITEILDDCVELGIKAVELTGGGEPTLHPDFPDILSVLNARGIEIGLVTNGAWREKHFEENLDGLQHATWVRFSLDAATSITHQRTHASHPKHFQVALEAIKRLTEHSTADVGISFIVQQSNYHELEDAVNLAESLGVKYIRIGGVVFEGERIDNIELTLEQHDEVLRKLKLLKGIKRDIEIYDSFTDRSLVAFPRYNIGDTCYYSHLATVIGADGKLYTCCVWKYRPDGVIADLHQVGFAEAWNAGALEKFYQRFDIAEKCNRCFLKDKNDILHSFVTAKHVNFV